MRVNTRIAAAVALASMLILPAHGQEVSRAGASGSKVVVRGAGATFPAPLCEKWIMTCRQQNPDLMITYDVVGSGEGEKRFLANAVDFGASDAALRDDQLASVKPGGPARAGHGGDRRAGLQPAAAWRRFAAEP